MVEEPLTAHDTHRSQAEAIRRPAVALLVADDQVLSREAVVRAVTLHPGVRLVAEVGDADEAASLCTLLHPAVALISDALGAGAGGDRFLRVAAGTPTTAVVFLGLSPSADDLADALTRGIAGYVLRTMSSASICTELLTAARGEPVLPRELHAHLVTAIRRQGALPMLTEREHTILAMSADGRDRTAIAGALFLSPATVKTHLSHIYDKLGVNSATAAVAFALRHGMLS